jgi:hypothetical protein
MSFDRNVPRCKDPGFTSFIMIPALIIALDRSYRDINYGNCIIFFPPVLLFLA